MVHIDQQSRIDFCRANVQKSVPAMTISGLIAASAYIAALYFGRESIGWYMFVVAVAASFVTISIGNHVQEQEQTADLIESMVSLVGDSAKGG